MQENKRERNISLRDLLLKFFLQWRRVLVISLLVSIFMGVVCSARFSLISSEEYDNAVAKYEDEVQAYDTSVSVLKNQVITTKDDMKRQEAYNKNSILMSIDATKEVVGCVSYYIDTHYEIFLDKTVQNIDYSNRVLAGYASYLQNGQFIEELKARLNIDKEIRYISELVEVSYDYTNMILTIRIKQEDEASCTDMVNMVETLISEKKDEIERSVYKHTITKLNDTMMSTIDNGLIELQQNNIQAIDSMNKLLISTTNDLEELEKQGPPIFKYSKFSYLRSSVLKVIASFLASMFVYLLISAILYIESNKLHESRELVHSYKINIIDTIATPLKSRIDRIIKKKFGCKTTLEEQQKAKLIVRKIELLLNSAKTGDDNVKSILLTTSAELDEELFSLCKQLNKANSSKQITFLAGGNQRVDLKTMEYSKNADYIILLEKCETSVLDEVLEEIRVFQSYGKGVLGCIVIE